MAAAERHENPVLPDPVDQPPVDYRAENKAAVVARLNETGEPRPNKPDSMTRSGISVWNRPLPVTSRASSAASPPAPIRARLAARRRGRGAGGGVCRPSSLASESGPVRTTVDGSGAA